MTFFDPEQYKADQFLVMTAFNKMLAGTEDFPIEFTDPDGNETLAYIGQGKAYQAGELAGFCAELKALDPETGEVLSLPVDFVKICEVPEVAEPPAQETKQAASKIAAELVTAATKAAAGTVKIAGVDLTPASQLKRPKAAAKPKIEPVQPEPKKAKLVAVEGQGTTPKATPKAEVAPLTVNEPLVLADIPAETNDSDTRRITSLKITNIMGIDEMLIPLNGVATFVEGGNGQGKTSALKAAQAVIGGGYPAELIRNGAESGEVVLVMDDKSTVRKLISHKKSSTTIVKDEAGKKINAPQKFLNTLFDSVAVDPRAFLDSNAKKQVQLMLEASPMSLTVEQAAQVAEVAPEVDLTEHPLYALDSAIKYINADRTQTNADIRSQEAFRGRIKDGLAEQEGDTTKDLDGLNESLATEKDKLNKVHQVCNDDTNTIREEADKNKHEISLENADEIEKLQDNKRELEQEIESLQQRAANLAQEAALIQAKCDSKANENIPRLEAITAKMGTDISNRNAAAMVEQNSLENEIAAIERNIHNYSHYQRSLDNIAGYDAEIKESKDLKNSLDSHLELIQKIKSEILKSIPIDGLEVTEEGIFHGGVKFSLLNTAMKANIAIKVAVMRLDQNPDAVRLVIVDGLESMDSGTIHALIDAAAHQNVQIFGARTTDNELAITHH